MAVEDRVVRVEQCDVCGEWVLRKNDRYLEEDLSLHPHCPEVFRYRDDSDTATICTEWNERYRPRGQLLLKRLLRDTAKRRRHYTPEQIAQLRQFYESGMSVPEAAKLSGIRCRSTALKILKGRAYREHAKPVVIRHRRCIDDPSLIVSAFADSRSVKTVAGKLGIKPWSVHYWLNKLDAPRNRPGKPSLYPADVVRQVYVAVKRDGLSIAEAARVNRMSRTNASYICNGIYRGSDTRDLALLYG